MNPACTTQPQCFGPQIAAVAFAAFGLTATVAQEATQSLLTQSTETERVLLTDPTPEVPIDLSYRFREDTLSLGAFGLQDDSNSLLKASPPPDTDPGKLAASAQNPIASSFRFPLESNILINSGPDNETGYVGNFQPVLPVSLSEDWNLISRPIVPIMFTPGAVPGLPGNGGIPEGFDDTFGLGDINYTAFFSPSAPIMYADDEEYPGQIIWGAGPSITFPTATDDVLGSGKWQLGASVVALTVKKPIVAGALVRHLWSVGGDSSRADVNQSILQPFINYNLDDGWYLVTSPIFVADWEAPSNERWTVPIGGGGGKIFSVAGQPMNASMQLFYNVERPTNAPEWQLQFTIMLLFPK